MAALVIMLSLLQIFSGFLKNLRSIDDWISWLQYLSIIRYAINVCGNVLNVVITTDKTNSTTIHYSLIFLNIC